MLTDLVRPTYLLFSESLLITRFIRQTVALNLRHPITLSTLHGLLKLNWCKLPVSLFSSVVLLRSNNGMYLSASVTGHVYVIVCNRLKRIARGNALPSSLVLIFSVGRFGPHFRNIALLYEPGHFCRRSILSSTFIFTDPYRYFLRVSRHPQRQLDGTEQFRGVDKIPSSFFYRVIELFERFFFRVLHAPRHGLAHVRHFDVDAPSVILRRLVLGMSVIVALSLSFLSFSLSFRSRSRSPVLFLSEGRRGAQNRRRRFVGWINYVDFIKMSFPFFPFFFPNVDVRCQTVVLAENEKKKLLEDGGGKKGAQEEKVQKKTAFDRVLLESKQEYI